MSWRLRLKSNLIIAVLVVLSMHAVAGTDAVPSVWNRPVLREVPAVFPAEGIAEGINEPGVRALFFESVPYRGKPTRVFAWYGVPKNGGSKFPAMVLVHGGGGTADAQWVRRWNELGYAAIAMDTNGGVPAANKAGSQPHAWHGPVGLMATFDQIDEPNEDQWPYHAVAAIMRAHSLIRSFPEVDSSRIGVTGVSWGGYLTCMVAGIDDRFACAAPVYGCGFFNYNSGGFFDKLQNMGERGKKWAALWDASTVLPNAHMPILWLNGTTDHWFPIPSWQHSYRIAPGTVGLALRTEWPHNGTVGANAPEIGHFADFILSGGKPLPGIVEQKVKNEHLFVRWESPLPIAEVEFNYTADSGVCEKRKWNTVYVPFDAAGKKMEAAIPPEATTFYCNVVDRDGMIASSDCTERTPTARPAAAVNGFVMLNEDFEGRGVGISPRGVTQDRNKGATIEITDEAAASGNRSLRFKASSPKYDILLMRDFYLGSNQMNKGKVTLSFNFRNSLASPGQFFVEMRDMRKTPHQRGPRLEFMPNGKLMAGNKEVMTLPLDSWTRIAVNMTLDGNGGKMYKLTVTGQNGDSQTFDIPCSPEFAAVSWTGFIMVGNMTGVVYLDDILLSCSSEDI